MIDDSIELKTRSPVGECVFFVKKKVDNFKITDIFTART